ncbi:rest corepressor corest protein-related [Holotrichia oblita]|uniref:Rest corepressor corest protein-related n=1 Tax=Holotrichia oblita TaxID=644536 RepID=A0ACB9TXY4_HOLOL|nr:rest corepressor corest protein-related [Holotrichia oblita]
MVLAEKNSENARNGRRSRGPSPNGHVQAESTSEDESTVPVDKIRVGRDYQAVCPELQPESLRKPELLADRALLVWSPTTDIPESKLEDYIILAKDKYGYNGEQALGMLFWHKHDLERAVLDLANFTPFPDEWSVEDKVLFEQAFQFHGKSFHRIRQMLPDKSIASLVKYYYSWKKTRSRTSLMDKQARKLQQPREDGAPSEAGSEGGSNEESDHDEKIQQNKQAISNLKRKHSDSIEDLRPTNDNSSRVNARWTNEELLLAVQGVRKYGKDFKSIAEVLGNKTEHHVRTFFVNYRKRYNLDNVLKEYEKDHGPIVEDSNDEKMELDDSNNDNNSDVICLSPTPPSVKKDFKNSKIAIAQGSK